MKYLKKLQKYTYCIKRKMSTFQSSWSEEPDKMFVNNVISPETKFIEKFNFMFMLPMNPPAKAKKINMCRNVNDSISTFIDRLHVKINQVCNKRTEKPKKSEIDFYLNGHKVCRHAKCDDVFEISNPNLILRIKDITLKVQMDVPLIHDLKLNTPVYEGLMLYPFGFDKDVNHNVTMADCKYSWFRVDSNYETEVANTFSYTPTENDVNCSLKLVCIPGNRNKEYGPFVEISSSAVLKNDVQIYPFENRLKEKPNNNSIRVVSYNILAGEYTRTKEAKTVMYPYCPEEVLVAGYRNPLVLKEILAYKADILCLQEVELGFFKTQLKPLLKHFAFMKGEFFKKNNRRSEGLACFYSPDKFKLLEQFNIKLNDQEAVTELCGPIITQIMMDDSSWKDALEKHTVFQALILEQVSDKKHLFMICNTHLISDPLGDSVRLLQALVELVMISRIKMTVMQEYPNRKMSIIFCGDFNSTPDSGVYDLATSLELLEKYRDVELLNDLKNMLNYKLKSAYGTDVEYSNYTQSFSGLLDYIYFTEEYLEVVQVLPMPPHDDVIKHVGLPSLLFPSDHLPLIADFKLK